MKLGLVALQSIIHCCTVRRKREFSGHQLHVDIIKKKSKTFIYYFSFKCHTLKFWCDTAQLEKTCPEIKSLIKWITDIISFTVPKFRPHSPTKVPQVQATALMIFLQTSKGARDGTLHSAWAEETNSSIRWWGFPLKTRGDREGAPEVCRPTLLENCATRSCSRACFWFFSLPGKISFKKKQWSKILHFSLVSSFSWRLQVFHFKLRLCSVTNRR